MRFSEIVEKVERVREMFSEESRRFHAIQVLRGIEPFIVARLGDLANGEKVSLVQYLHLVIGDLDGLELDDERRNEGKHVRMSLDRALGKILAFDAR